MTVVNRGELAGLVSLWVLVSASVGVAAPDLRTVRQRFDLGAELESQAVEFFRNGEDSEGAKRLSQALRIYRKILEEDPRDKDVPLRIGAILVHDDRCTEALPILAKSAKDAYGVDTTALRLSDRKRFRQDAKLRQLALLIGQCRLAQEPDTIGFEILEHLNDLPTELHYLLGRRYRQVDRPEQAVHHLKVYLQQHPEDVQIRLAVANLQLKLGRLSAAESSYLRVLKERPSNMAALKNLGVVQVRKKSYAAAQKTLTRVILKAPNDTAARFNLAAVLARQGKHQQTVEELRRVVSLSPCLLRAWLRLGESLAELKEYIPAEKAVQQAIDCKADYVPSYVALGQLYVLRKEYQLCISSMQNTLARMVDQPQILNVLGVCYRESGSTENAVAIHLKAEAILPGEASILRELSKDYMQLGQYSNAVAVLRRMPQATEQLAQTLGSMGVHQLNNGDIDGALESLQEAVELQPKDNVIYHNLGVAWLSSGALPKAAEVFRKRLKNDPSHLGAKVGLAQVLLKRHKYLAVVRRLSSVPQKIMNSGCGSYTLGIAYLRLRNYSESIKYLSNAADLLPENQAVKLHLAQAYVLDAQYEQAWSILITVDIQGFSDEEKGFLSMLIAYSGYNAGHSVALTKILGSKPTGILSYDSLLASIWGEAGVQLGKARRVGESQQALIASNRLKPDLTTRANMASTLYLMGSTQQALSVWRGVMSKKVFPELMYNYAIYYDDIGSNELMAYRWYRRYARTPVGRRWSQRSKVLIRKKEWFGF